MPPGIIYQTRGRLKPTITSSIMYSKRLEFFNPAFEFYDSELLKRTSVFSDVKPVLERVYEPSLILVTRRRKFKCLRDQLRYLVGKGVFSCTYVEMVVCQLERRHAAAVSQAAVCLRNKYMVSCKHEVYLLPRRLDVFETPFLNYVELSLQLKNALFNFEFMECVLQRFEDKVAVSIYLCAVRICKESQSLVSFFDKYFMRAFLESEGVLEDNPFFRRAALSIFLRVLSYATITVFKLSSGRAYVREMAHAILASRIVESRLMDISGCQADVSRLKLRSEELNEHTQALERQESEIKSASVILDEQFEQLEQQLLETAAAQQKRQAECERFEMEQEDLIARNSRVFASLAPRYAELQSQMEYLSEERINVNSACQVQREQSESVRAALSERAREFDALLAQKEQTAQTLAAETQRFQRLKERRIAETKKNAEEQLRRLMSQMDGNLSCLRERIDFANESRNLRALWELVAGEAVSGSLGELGELNLSSLEPPAAEDARQLDVRVVLDRRYADFAANLERLHGALLQIEEFVARELEEMQARRVRQEQEMAALQDMLEQLRRDAAEAQAQAGSEAKWRLKRADGEIIKAPPQELLIEPQLTQAARAIVARYGELEYIFDCISGRELTPKE